MARIRFLRRAWWKYKKLGRKKKLKWRRPKGRDNALRLRKKGYQRAVEIGYRKRKKERGKINNLTPIIIRNIKELNNVGKNEIAIIARVGRKKKNEILKKANEMKIKILNMKKILTKGDK